MRRLLVALFVLVTLPLIASASASRHGGCAPRGQPRVVVRIADYEPSYDFSLSLEAIQDMANTVVHRVRQGWALGLTRSQPLLQADTDMNVEPVGAGYCARPATIVVTLGYSDITTFIPNDLWGDSCGFHAILDHETKHLKVAREILQALKPIIEDNVQALLKERGSSYAPTALEARALMNEKLKLMLDATGAQIRAMTAAQQETVDRDEDSDRMLTVCQGELKQLIANVRLSPQLATGY